MKSSESKTKGITTPRGSHGGNRSNALPVPADPKSNEPPSMGDVTRGEPTTSVTVVCKDSLASASVSTSVVVSTSVAASEYDSEIWRQFWRVGDYEVNKTGARSLQGAIDHLRIHPKFLHSNATSHKWALGAIAELLDNAMDEVQNGATYVSVDKIVNPRDGTPALLIKDDGGGMTPDTMRECMSLGYSGKKTNTIIGQYGNGFKTSTMRLGADVIVFSSNTQGSVVTKSIGLLSYTFLRKTGLVDVVVPMIDYQVSPESLENREPPQKMIRTTMENWLGNLSSIMKWSPYSSEVELLDQFENIGCHGTKVIIYNLWLDEDGELELDFDTDERDIQLRGGLNEDKTKLSMQQHIANQYCYSLGVYASILYLQMPAGFQIILRGKAVEHRSMASELQFSQQKIYKPQIVKDKDLTTSVKVLIGFVKEAPRINVHGFNVYHKNRLILPFWKVRHGNSSVGRGVVGVLEANFVEPAHDKQDFERTAVLLRLETRLKHMVVDYWNLHCHLFGYEPHTKAGKLRKRQASQAIANPFPVASLNPIDALPTPWSGPSIVLATELGRVEPMACGGPSKFTFANSEGPQVNTEPFATPLNSSKRSRSGDTTSEAVELSKRQHTAPNTQEITAAAREAGDNTESRNDVVIDLTQENRQLRSKCADYELDVKKIESKVLQLENELLDEYMKTVNFQKQYIGRLRNSLE